MQECQDFTSGKDKIIGHRADEMEKNALIRLRFDAKYKGF